jgi:hypothetical protein
MEFLETCTNFLWQGRPALGDTLAKSEAITGRMF